MNQTKLIQAIYTLSFCSIAFLAGNTQAQDANVNTAEPPLITQSLISRGELSRLMNQPARNGNPLRRIQATQAAPIRDSSVRPASWQEESPTVSSKAFRINRPESGLEASSPQVNPTPQEAPSSAPIPKAIPSPVALDAEHQTFGPAPSPKMKDNWIAIDLIDLEKEIAKQRINIDGSLGIDEQAKEQRLQQLAIAEEAYKRASQNNATKADYQRRITDLNAGLERLKLEAKQSSKPQSVDHNLSIDAMQSMLRDLQAKLQHEKTSELKTLDKIQNRDKRMNTIPGERLDKLNEVSELHEELIRQQATGTSDVISLLAIRAQELAATTKVQSLEQEASWHDLSQEWLPLEKTIHQRRIQRLESELKSWNTVIANRKKAELEKQIRLAHQKAVEAHPSLRALSEQTTLLTEARSALATKMGELHNETLIVSKQEDSVKKQRTDLETSIKDIGKDDSSGLLIQVHRNLIRPYEGMARIQEMENELRLSRGKVLKLRSEQEPLSHPETYIPDSLDIHHDVAVADTTLIALAHEAIETHRQQLTALVGDNEDYQKLLNEVLPKRKSLLAEIAATRELVDTHALWVQSSDPMGLDVLHKSREGAKEFFDPDQWQDLGDSIVGRMKSRPYESAVGMLGLMVAFVIGRRFKG